MKHASMLAAAVCAAFSVPAVADETPPQVMGTITINGGRTSSLPTEIPTTLETVTGEQIATAINASDSEDALKYLPSLLVRKRYAGDYNHAVLSTRASGTGNSARSLVYADGILLSNLLGNGATFAPRWAMVAPEQIERVDVLYGPFSAAYSGNAVGAVVDYQTRMPVHLETHAKLSASVQPFRLYATRETERNQQGSLGFGDSSGPWSWYLDLSHQDNEGQPLGYATRLATAGTAGGDGTPVNGAVAGADRSLRPWSIIGTSSQYHSLQDHATLKLSYRITPDLRLNYVFGLWQNTSSGQSHSYLHDAAGQPVSSGTIKLNGRVSTLSASDFPRSEEGLRHTMQGLSLKSSTRSDFDWEVAASMVDYGMDQLRAPLTLAEGGAGRLVDQHGTGWRTLAVKGIWRPGQDQVIEAGLQHEAYRLANTEYATIDWRNGSAGARNQGFAGRTALDSIWLQDAWHLAQAWRVVLGLRLEHWSASDGALSNASSIVQLAPRSATYASPKAALSWLASDAWLLKASLGRAVRMPTVSELYQGGVNAAGVVTNNDPNLLPERSWTSEWSAERDLGTGTWRTTAFFETTADALYSQTNVLVTPNLTNIQNVDRIRTHGLETALALNDLAVRGLDLNASLTWTDSKIAANRRFPASVGKWQPRVPAWRASALASWHPAETWSLSYGLRYSGRQYSTLDNSDPNGFAYQGASSYFTTDLRATRKLGGGWSLAAGIDNLNNYQYWNFHPYPQRSFVAELRYDRN